MSPHSSEKIVISNDSGKGFPDMLLPCGCSMVTGIPANLRWQLAISLGITGSRS